MNRVDKMKAIYIELAQQRIDMMAEMPSTSPTRLKWFEASKALIPYIQNVATDEWILKHDKAGSTLIDMHADIV